MGKIEFNIDINNKILTLDWSALTTDQLYWVGRSQGYPLQIENPDIPGEFIDNPVPVVPWVLSKRLKELATAAFNQYLAETPDPRIAAANAIADFQPNAGN